MILVENVKITNKRLSINLPRGNLKTFTDRLDVCKYALSSYAALLPLLSKVILYIDLKNTEYAGQEENLEKFIRELFPEDKLLLRWFRNETFADWRNSCEKDIFPIDDNLIMNVTNDDHIFIDSNLNTLQECLNSFSNCQDPYVNMMYSHWPESIRMSASGNFSKYINEYTTIGQYRSVESFDILKKERWKHYWFDHNGPIIRWPFFRPESLIDNGIHILPNGTTMLFPTKEMFRHFDGYNHAYDLLNLCPPLEIPEGFFENKIKIRYGYNQAYPGWVNINPAYPNYKAVDYNGVDFKFALEDIPLFWKDKIETIDINPDCNQEQLRELRDENLYNLASNSIGITHNKYPKSFFKTQYISNKWKGMED